MSEVASIISFVSWGSTLTLELYDVASVAHWATGDLNNVARAVSLFTLTLKQVGTSIKEDDAVPSAEAVETIQDILNQCKQLFGEIESLVPIKRLHDNGEHDTTDQSLIEDRRLDFNSKNRLDYLLAHLEALKSTLCILLQTLYTVQIILWARTRPTISPQKATDAVHNEMAQMEMLILEQQLALVKAANIYQDHDLGHASGVSRYLMEEDTSQSLTSADETTEDSLTPSRLFYLQEPSLATLDVNHSDVECLRAVRQISKPYIDSLLVKWSRLGEIELRHEEDAHRKESKKRESQQAYVESDEEDDQLDGLPHIRSYSPHLRAPSVQHPPDGQPQPLFPNSPTLPVPIPDLGQNHPPLSPASSYGISPRTSLTGLPSPNPSPRSSIGALPFKAASAVASRDDEDSDLGVPWRLCLRQHFWEYIDGRIDGRNTDKPTSDAFNERNGWTEVLASWVCKDAIKEAGYSHSRFKRDRQEGRRTKLDDCFRIERPLTYPEVKRLVERTVEIYRKNRPPTPPPSRRQSSIDHSSSSSEHPPSGVSRHKERLASNPAQPSPLNRSTSAYYPQAQPPPPPPPLDRHITLPTPSPTVNPYFQSGLQSPMTQFPQSPMSPFAFSPSSAATYTPGSQTTCVPGSPLSQGNMSPFSPMTPHYPSTSHQLPPIHTNAPPTSSPLSPLHTNPAASRPPFRHAFTANDFPPQLAHSTTSESDGEAKRRTYRSSSRRSSASAHGRRERDKKKGSATVGTLAKVGGLAVLLEGLL